MQNPRYSAAQTLSKKKYYISDYLDIAMKWGQLELRIR